MRHSRLRLPTAVAALGLAALCLAASASATPGQTLTFHYNSIVDQWGTPTGPTTNVSDCPTTVLSDYTDINATGNGVTHETGNSNGFWSTSTFTGTATVAFYNPANLAFDLGGNVTSATGPPDMVVTGHITDWFGVSANKQNLVAHGTVDFHGTVDGTGAPISFHNVVHFAWLPGMDQNGPPSFFFNVASC